MPERKTIQKAKRDLRRGRSASTAAGEFVREEMHHIREGKHGARSTKQAIAIALSKARRAGVPLEPGGRTAQARSSEERDLERGQHRGGRARKASSRGRSASSRGRTASRTRARGVMRALKREPHRAASHRALSKQAHQTAARRGHAARSASARKASRTKGPTLRHRAAQKAARTRARHAHR